MNNSIQHSGDEVTGDAPIDEMIWVRLAKLPSPVKLIIFVVSAYNEGRLRDASNARVKIFEGGLGRTIHQFKIERSAADVDVVAMMVRDMDNNWALKEVDEPAEDGSNFLDIIEPTVGDLIRREIPAAPSFIQVTFQMDKGAAVDLPTTSAWKRLLVCIGGHALPSAKHAVDIDIAAVFFSAKGTNLGAVSVDNPSKFGLTHSGDGGGKSDDEAISVDVAQISKEVAYVFFVVHVYTEGASFKDIHGAYCRITDENCNTLANYEVKGKNDQTGLVVSRLFRKGAAHDSQQWGLQALGTFCSGSTWKDAKDDLAKLCQQSTSGNRKPKKQRSAKSVAAQASTTAAQPEETSAAQPPETPAAEPPEIISDSPAAEMGMPAPYAAPILASISLASVQLCSVPLGNEVSRDMPPPGSSDAWPADDVSAMPKLRRRTTASKKIPGISASADLKDKMAPQEMDAIRVQDDEPCDKVNSTEAQAVTNARCGAFSCTNQWAPWTKCTL
eukprot:gnl/TRDRNA2_/TRDRNA2_129545_c0_seq1.p1 gnl/TRDRNA2_/TRDRNA2_129545_c0~~gnl/TRDRNA2_/TRDRNA2_129545_c0_seq1.p1  ORF type:complete len:500 (+),score=91.94 gnl/TRDRNA2_/TRDRNA2_129545_c0_seq1:263-1762(+)